jgi:hypothetical protein
MTGLQIALTWPTFGTLDLSYLALAKMIIGYKYVKGYQVDEERACILGEVDPPTERMKSVMVASRMIDRDDYLLPAVGYLVARISWRKCEPGTMQLITLDP